MNILKKMWNGFTKGRVGQTMLAPIGWFWGSTSA